MRRKLRRGGRPCHRGRLGCGWAVLGFVPVQEQPRITRMNADRA